MRLHSRSIPWISISIPWNRRSIPWIFRSKATFQRKNSPETCHIVAKIAFWGVHAVMRRTDVLYYQTFLIFAYLRATAQPCENIRFSVLKKRGWGGLLSLWGKGWGGMQAGVRACRGGSCRRDGGRVLSGGGVWQRGGGVWPRGGGVGARAGRQGQKNGIPLDPTVVHLISNPVTNQPC